MKNPPTPKYQLNLTITGNTLDEIERELILQVNGGFMLDSQNLTRDEWRVIGGTITSEMECLNPDQTPEKYSTELDQWWAERKANR